MIDILQPRADADLLWSFGDREPHFLIAAGSYKRQVKVDPFPCYPHNFFLVRKEAERVSALFPLPQLVTIAILDRDTEAHTNGWTSIDTDYYSEKDERGLHRWGATIVLSGKRTPIHPAMTRYLVAHEYGHVVAQFLGEKLGVPSGNEKLAYDDRKMYREYAAMRGFDTAKHYGGGTWHASVEELFANDFRILVAQSEIEFWPHPGFKRPEELPAVVAFWESQRKDRLELGLPLFEGEAKA